jgi:ketosteroid isomerase-like protein
MKRCTLMLLMVGSLLGARNSPPAAHDGASAKAQVVATELAFARTMADRNHAQFSAFISEEAAFFGGPLPLRDKDAVVQAWARYFVAPAAPFSWEPDEVEMLASGTLALSSGSVRDAAGKLIARFTSIWRYEAPGVWRIVFDRGETVCDRACR